MREQVLFSVSSYLEGIQRSMHELDVLMKDAQKAKISEKDLLLKYKGVLDWGYYQIRKSRAFINRELSLHNEQAGEGARR